MASATGPPEDASEPDGGPRDGGAGDAGDVGPAPMDAPMDAPDAGGCTAPRTECGGECVDTSSDPEHCGRCGRRCAFANATAACESGVCRLALCAAGYGNCDGIELNGCETELTSLTDCGRCGMTCSRANATATCAGGSCRIAMCNAGFGNCDGNDANGCETDLNTSSMHCGMCGMACGNGRYCRAGTCRPRHLWSRRVGAGMDDRGEAVAVDASGNVYVTGWFRGEVDFGDGTVRRRDAPVGPDSYYVAKYDASGALQWVRYSGETIVGTGSSYGEGIAVDGSGNVYVTGYFDGNLEHSGALIIGIMGLSRNRDAFVLSFGPDGTRRWHRQIGGTGDQYGDDVAVDGSGNVYVTGHVAGSVDFGGGATAPLGAMDVFVASYAADGMHRWSRRHGGTSDEYGEEIAVHGSNVYVIGTFSGTATFGGAPLTSAMSSPDVFVASYEAMNGNYRWSWRFGGNGRDESRSIAVDGSGNLYVTGTFRATVDFGGGDLTSAGQADVFVASYRGSTGDHRWSRRYGGTVDDVGWEVAVDGSGNAYVTGYVARDVDLGGGTLSPAPSDTTWDIFVASYGGSDGAHRWSRRFGSTASAGDDHGYGLAVSSTGVVYLTGVFRNTVNFGGMNLMSAGGTDMFLVALEP